MSSTRHRRAAARIAALLAAPLAVQAQCPPPTPAVLLERFIPADCEACWQGGSAPPAGTAVLDWIVPVAAGDEAALAPAALTAATARAGAIAPRQTTSRAHRLPPPAGLTLSVEDGPAWNGYLGLRLQVRSSTTPLPAGAAGYLALVDDVPPGDEGTVVARRLVRVVAGPLRLEGAATEHLLAMRIPQGARVDRLNAVGWVEFEPGRPVAFAWSGEPACATPP